mgnify:CR=1 FL=1
MKGPRRNLFMPLTPYNLLLSFAIAATETKGEENILLLPDYNETTERALICLSPGIPAFSATIGAIGARKRETSLTRPFRKIEYSRSIDRLLKTMEFDAFFSFNDLKYQSQYAMSRASRFQPSCRLVHVEDGTADYCGVQVSGRSGLGKLFDRLVGGKWSLELDSFGTYPLISEYRFIFPEFATLAPRLPEGSVRGISAEGLMGLSPGEHAEKAYGKLDFERMRGPGSTLVLLDSEKYLKSHPEFLENLSGHIGQARSRGLKILLKKRLGSPCPLPELEGKDDVVILPGEIPSELVLLWFREQVREVLGGKSSSLATARWLCPKIPCTCLCGFIRGESPLGRLFRNIGIRPFKDEGAPA